MAGPLRLLALASASLLWMASGFFMPTSSRRILCLRELSLLTHRQDSNQSNSRVLLEARNRFKKDFGEASRRAEESIPVGAGEVAAGAILGGLLMGPFGALFGASVGSNLGSKRAMDKARRDEMERQGITPEMLQMAEEAGAALDRAVKGMEASQESLETQQAFARRLDKEADDLYEKAKQAMESSDEDRARTLLMDRNRTQERLKKALVACADEKKRLEAMERNVAAIEDRAMEIDALLRRSVGAKALQDTSMMQDFALRDEDPLLRKFREMENE